MDVFLKVGNSSCNLGSRDVLTTFFDTIACRLEPGGRGTRFPIVSHHLRLGRVTKAEAPEAIRELDQSGPELRKLPADKILWVGERPGAVNRSTNAAERLTALDGRPILEHLRDGARHALNTGQVLRLNCPDQDKREWRSTLGVAAAGIAWMVGVHILLPNIFIAPEGESPTDPMGIPLWSFGVLPTAFVIPNLVGLAVPGIKVWLALHKWGLVAWGLLVVGVWLVLSLMQ
jgi:hypothetical protein